MEELMLNEAKEQVVTGFEKFSSGAGVNTQVSNERLSADFLKRRRTDILHLFFLLHLDGMQVRKGIDGQAVWSCVARYHGRRFLI